MARGSLLFISRSVNGKFVGYVNVVKQAGRRYIDKAGKEECPVPDYLTEYLEKYHETLMESVAETSEEFMDRYFEEIPSP